MDTGLDQNQAELGVLVLAVALKVLANGDGLREEYQSERVSRHSSHEIGWAKRSMMQYLLDQEVKVLGKFGSEACIPRYLSVSLILDQAEA